MDPLVIAVVAVLGVGGALAAVVLARGRSTPGPTTPSPQAPRAPEAVPPLDEEPVGDPETVGDTDTVSDAITVNASEVVEKELSLAEKEELRALVDEGVELVEAVVFEPFDVDDSDAMVRAVVACVEGLRRGATYPSRWPDAGVAGRLLGLVWGEHLVASAAWRWVRLSSGETQGYAAVSPDRAHAVFPGEVVQKLLTDPLRPNPLLQAYEAVRDRRLPSAAPGSRTPLF